MEPAQAHPLVQEEAELAQLAALAANAEPEARLRHGSEINALLRRMRTEGDLETNARLVFQELAKRSLVGVVGHDGRSCRTEAVETLLRLGSPYALEIPPEDATHHRFSQTGRGPGGMAVLVFLVGAHFGALALLHPAELDGLAVPCLLVFAVSIVFLIVRWLQRLDQRKREQL